MNKRMVIASVFVLVAMLVSADEFTLQVTNTLDREIQYLFISSESSEYWGVDVLGGTEEEKVVIPSEASIQLSVSSETRTDTIDVLAIDSSGNIYEQWAVDPGLDGTVLVSIRSQQRFEQPITINSFLAPLRIENRTGESIISFRTAPGDVSGYLINSMHTGADDWQNGHSFVFWYIIGWEEPLLYYAATPSGSVSDTIWLEDTESLLVLE